MSKKIRIGTDIDLATCRNEGYLTMLADKADFSCPLDPEKMFVFAKCMPRFITGGRFTPYTNRSASANQLWAIYTKRKGDVDEFNDDTFEFPTDPYKLLNLADALEAYGGWVISNAY